MLTKPHPHWSSDAIPEVAQLGPNKWRIKFAGYAAFETDNGGFTAIVRSLTMVQQEKLFQILARGTR